MVRVFIFKAFILLILKTEKMTSRQFGRWNKVPTKQMI